jgi:hypothetical protein
MEAVSFDRIGAKLLDELN